MKEKVILVGVNCQKNINFEHSMEELKNLATGFQLDVVSVLTQNLNRINTSYYIGKGKLDEVKQIMDEKEVNKVIFNDELSPSQVRNLESALECIVLDRANLIIDIFNKRATSKESRIQVEIARLQYLLPRLVNTSASLSRQRGGGVINRGSGETKLENDRRKIKNQIQSLKKDLEVIVSERKTQRSLRQKNHMKVVSLVGYTNAGKSTILNVSMELFKSSLKNVFEKDMLFATLDTSVRHIKLNNSKSFLLTDTVGFIDKLPHQLINAFRSTLEEVLYSDLLIHVVDYSHPNYQHQMEIVIETLKEIGVKDIPIITVYNKTDLVEMDIPKIENDEIYLSAKNQIGIVELVKLIDKKLFTDFLTCKMMIPYENMNLVNYFHQCALIRSTSYNEKGTILALECSLKDFEKYQKYVL
ncbi:GTPase HflX [Mycoplasmatota bacterium]|nr:GTPase HflX [Mycoplasmatota bacterium]